MATPLFRRFRGYIAPALLTYTVLVTFVLVQTAWKDGTAVRSGPQRSKRGAVHRYVPSKEERRHLRSFEDVDGYGNEADDRHADRSLTNYGRGAFPPRALQNGRRVQSSLSNDFYVDDPNANANPNATTVINGTGTGYAKDSELLPPGGRDYILESRLYPHFRPDTGRQKFDGGDGGDDDYRSSNKLDAAQAYDKNKRPLSQHTDVEIEEMIPARNNETHPNNNNNGNNNNNVNKTALTFRHHSYRDRKAGGGSSRGEKSPGGDRSKHPPETQRSGSAAGTQFCDNIEHNGQLCYRDRVVFSHRNHVNISSTYQSFRSFGGLQIYSAFVDSRRMPAVIRMMTIGPKGYSDGASNLWCAFSSPMAVTRRYRWTGREDSIATGQTQASQLHFYAASDGHGKSKQFYVLSCDVPDGYLSTLNRLDGNRIDVVAGTQSSALLDVIQERMPVTVINNKGLPLHVLRQQRLLEKGRDRNIDVNIRSHNNNNNDNNHNNNNLRADRNVRYFDDKTGQRLDGAESDDDTDGEWRKVSASQQQRVNDKSSMVNPRGTARVIGNPVVGGNAMPDSRPPSSGGQDALVSCVAPIYGLNGIVQVTEFIELTLLLGIQHIVFYTHQLSADVQQILNMYKEQGLVTVLPWNIPDPAEIWAKGRDVALNDCLYRTMFLYDFVFFHDMDEFLIPKAAPDLPSLMVFLRTKGRLNATRISDIVFNSAYFAPPTKAHLANLTAAVPGYTKDVPKFVTLRSLHRTYFSSQHTLRIIKPTAALRVGAGERKRTTFYINPRFAGVNHYSKCPNATTTTSTYPESNAAGGGGSSGRNPFGRAADGGPKPAPPKEGQPLVDCVHTKHDDAILKYKDKLIQNTKDSIRAFNVKGRVRR